ncbi:DUF6887 family protein [Synechocystis sp. PCC 7509]|uniref:DUF6887 family protein n=1 Tax=Synechocystis sp. PCC 7509 TaxID=927677 RepID=UPI0002ABD8A4|nr:hypothetical protein [Synechocystis sp. PCC 7509]
MSTDYASMSDRELKRYIMEHRTDNNAFHAYMDRRYTRPNRQVISPNQPDWETKIDIAIQKQIQEGKPPTKVGNTNLKYDLYKGYAIAVQKIEVLSDRWHYIAKPLSLENENLYPLQWDAGKVESYGEDLADAVRKCKSEIDKLVSAAS